MQSLLADEFARRGWQWDLATGRGIVEEIEKRRAVEPARLAQRAPADWIARNHTTRAELAEAIEAAIGGLAPSAPTPTTLVIHGSQYNITVSGSNLTDSPIEVGGTRVNVSSDSGRQEVLDAVAALIRAGLSDGWNADAATALAGVIEQREDLGFEDVQKVTGDVVRAEQPNSGRAKAFLEKVAAGGLGGALGTGISAGVGEMLLQLPI